jgi:hypothetical protein
MTGRTFRTRSGKNLTDEDIEAIAADVATTDPDMVLLKKRRHPGAPGARARGSAELPR